MKIKLWQFEYDFDRRDAKIVVPVILLVVAVSVTNVNPQWLLAAATTYYLLYFFLLDAIRTVKAALARTRMRCPNCKNRKFSFKAIRVINPMNNIPIIIATAANRHRF